MVNRLYRLLQTALCLSLGACPSAVTSTAECTSAADCVAPQPAPCAGCPPEYDEICVSGVCEARAGDTTEIFADVNLNRNIASDVRSLVHVLVDPRMGPSERSFSCDDAFVGDALALELNVLSAGYKALSGGSFHPAVSLGRAPAGPLAILLVATTEAGGSGNVLAKTCLEPVDASETSYNVGLVQLEP